MDKDRIISGLIIRMERLERRIRELEGLEKENGMLRERLAKYENLKNGRNSSVAPSKDEDRPKKNQGPDIAAIAGRHWRMCRRSKKDRAR